MKSTKIEYPLVCIEWHDSRLGYQGWKSLDDIELQVMTCKSVGFLVKQDADSKLLVPHLNGNNTNGAGEIVIPRSAILKETLLPL